MKVIDIPRKYSDTRWLIVMAVADQEVTSINAKSFSLPSLPPLVSHLSFKHIYLILKSAFFLLFTQL